MQRTFDFALAGGLDLTTPAATIKPGRVISAKNYEPDDEGGYRRLGGYEIFDGRPKPSEAAYWIVPFDTGTTEPVEDEVMTGNTSSHAFIVHTVVLESGSWVGNDAAGYIVGFEMDFDAGEDFLEEDELLTGSIAASVRTNGKTLQNAAGTDTLHEQYLRAAREFRRAALSGPAGSGAIRGVWLYSGTVYCVRDNAGATAAVLFEADSNNGWQAVSLGDYVDYDTGATALLEEGETINFAPSGATAVVVSMGVTSGSISGGNAAGRVYLKSVSGTPTAADTITGATSGGTSNCNSSVTAVTLPPGGKYEFRNYNFGGSTATYAMWGCNGEGRGFRYDGTDFSFIHVTGLSDSVDKPEHLHVHKRQLFFSFGASLQHSGVGTPMVWNAVFGAGEIATGDNITNLRDQPGEIMGVFNRNNTYLLYGNDSNDWDLRPYSLERGAIEWTAQNLGWSVYLDDRGINTLRATDAWADLKMDSISEIIDPLVQRKKALAVDSIRIKAKNQYRLFFSDKTGIICRFDTRNRREFMPFEYDHQVSCICAEEDLDGFESIYFGADDGNVYQADSGESFDGAVIEYDLRLAFCHCASPRQKKRFHKATIQIDALDVPDLMFSPEFSYGAPDQPPPSVFNFPEGTLNVGGGIWDEATWESFIWDGQLVGEALAYIDGQGINVSMLIKGESNFETQHTLQSMTYNFSMRGVRR